MKPLFTITLFMLISMCPAVWAQEFILSTVNEEIDEQIMVPYRTAFANGDVNQLMTICTPNTIIYNGDNSITIGLDSIRSRFLQEFNIYEIEVLVSGNERLPLAEEQVLEIGNFRMDYKAKKGENTFEVQGEYSMVLEKVGDQWKLAKFVNHNRGVTQ